MIRPITTYSLDEIADLFDRLGEKAFRRKQLLSWLYGHGASNYDEMTNLSKALRARLSEDAPLEPVPIVSKLVSSDGTRKYVFELFDGQRIESVAIPSRSSKERLTACVSSQVGCAMGCAFCATGHEGFTRNLFAGEIARQIVEVQADMGRRVSNVVIMGQGEPFLNYDSTLAALRLMNSPDALGIGARHIVVSTCGIIPGIERFAAEPEQFTLAISLHTARQELRDALMPKASAYPLTDLKLALQSYLTQTNRRITFEYLLIDGVNDTDADIIALEQFCHGLLCHINFLPMNSVASSPFQPSPQSVVQAWTEYFNDHGIEATVRTSRGSDIAGACGQLKNALSCDNR